MILVIDRSKKNAIELSDMFHYMGFISYGVAAKDAFSEISNRYRAIIINSPSELSDPKDYVEKLRKYAPTATVCALIRENEETEEEYFDLSIKKNTYTTRIVKAIMDYATERELPRIGRYLLAGVDLSVDLSTPLYFFEALPFTKTESMILRYLITEYPTPANAEMILKHAYRPSRRPDASNVRTHISVINKKFRAITGRNLINSLAGEGYAIYNPTALTV